MTANLEWTVGGQRASDRVAVQDGYIYTIYENAQDNWTLDDGEAIKPFDDLLNAKIEAEAIHQFRVN